MMMMIGFTTGHVVHGLGRRRFYGWPIDPVLHPGLERLEQEVHQLRILLVTATGVVVVVVRVVGVSVGVAGLLLSALVSLLLLLRGRVQHALSGFD